MPDVPINKTTQATLANDEAPALNSNNTISSEPSLIRTFQLAVDDDHAELSSEVQTNTGEHLSIPREIISTSISSTSLQTEILRPLIAGTYNGKPAYLLKLQFQSQMRGGGQDWLNRIQSATITVVVDDAPLKDAIPTRVSLFGRRKRPGRPGDDALPPAIITTFPGPEGWKGPISTAQTYNEVNVGLQAGYMGVGANTGYTQHISKDIKGAAEVTTMRSGQHRNILSIRVAENPIDSGGIPSCLVVPMVVTHHSRRFSMHVTVKATFGFWRGKLADSIPILGKADEPLYFDPVVLDSKIERKDTGIGGVHIVEWMDKLEDISLKTHSSLQDIGPYEK